jgi:S1-C subfamily serine protease
VYIEAAGSQCGWTGSGSIVGDGSYVLTNQHVSGDGECDLTVWLTDSTTAAPTKYVRAEVIESDSLRDLSVIQMRDSNGQPFVDASRKPIKFSTSLPKLGDKLTILGYPGIGGSTITLTSGDFSGMLVFSGTMILLYFLETVSEHSNMCARVLQYDSITV